MTGGDENDAADDRHERKDEGEGLPTALHRPPMGGLLLSHFDDPICPVRQRVVVARQHPGGRKGPTELGLKLGGKYLYDLLGSGLVRNLAIHDLSVSRDVLLSWRKVMARALHGRLSLGFHVLTGIKQMRLVVVVLYGARDPSCRAPEVVPDGYPVAPNGRVVAA